MKNVVAWVALAVSVVALCFAVVQPGGEAGNTVAVKQESMFERVMRTRTIRCGYAAWEPVLFKDAKTGELRGISRDLMEEIGKKLDVKIEWAEETGWGTLIEGLSTHRYDMICESIGLLAPRARSIDFSLPVFYGAGYMVVRANDDRVHHLEDLNSPDFKLAVLEGEAFSFLAPKKFPQARIDALPQNTDFSLIFQEVETGKADATGAAYADFVRYDRANPGKLKIVAKDRPIFVYSTAFGLPQGDVAFKAWFDAALGELLGDGTVERAVRAYVSPEEFLLPIKPYALPPS